MSDTLSLFLVFATLAQITGLIILGLQLREARHETRRLFTATAGMVHQEAERIIADALRRQP